METLQLKLKKNLLIVDVPEGVYDWKQIGEFLHFGFILNNEDKIGAIQVGFNPIKFLCKGSELTEEIAKKMVERVWNGYKNYNESEPVGNYKRLVFDSALESFKSAVEAGGMFWLFNPIPKKIGFAGNVSDDEIKAQLQKHKMIYERAQSRTFTKECLIFKIV